MRIVRHTEQQFAAEERPVVWGALCAAFTVALVVLVAEVVARGAGWQTLTLALFCLVSGYLLFTIDRVWLVLDREANIAEIRAGRDRRVMSVDALMAAEIRRAGGGHVLALSTALGDTPLTLASTDADAAALRRCAEAMNAWLRGQPAPLHRPAGAPMLDSEPLLT